MMTSEECLLYYRIKAIEARAGMSAKDWKALKREEHQELLKDIDKRNKQETRLFVQTVINRHGKTWQAIENLKHYADIIKQMGTEATAKQAWEEHPSC